VSAQPDYLRVGQVVKLTGLGRETVRRRINSGEFGDFLFDATAGYLVSRAGVEAWIWARLVQVARPQRKEAASA
jgi:hypothetical protein